MRKWILSAAVAAWSCCGSLAFAQVQAVVCPPVALTPVECRTMDCKMVQCEPCRPLATLTCIEPCDRGCKSGGVVTATPVCQPTSSAGCAPVTQRQAWQPQACTPAPAPHCANGACASAAPARHYHPQPISSTIIEVDCNRSSGGVICGNDCNAHTPKHFGHTHHKAPRAKSKTLLECLRGLFARDQKTHRHGKQECNVCTQDACTPCVVPGGDVGVPTNPGVTPATPPATPPQPAPPRVMPPAERPQTYQQIPGSYPAIVPASSTQPLPVILSVYPQSK